MRIIAGARARMTILPPRGMNTRPITDRVKESLFNILQFDIEGTRVADLFCGTGSMGLEALSRGAEHVIFVDSDREAINLLYKNIFKLDFRTVCAVVPGNALAGIPAADSSGQERPPCNLVFVDPPYKLSLKTEVGSPLGDLLMTLAAQTAPRARIIVRHEMRAELLRQYASLHLADRREYGNMALSFLENISDSDE